MKTNTTQQNKTERCRHERNSWLIARGNYEWCYVCGALRKMKTSEPNFCHPISKWCKPTGDKENNPYSKWSLSIKEEL